MKKQFKSIQQITAALGISTLLLFTFSCKKEASESSATALNAQSAAKTTLNTVLLGKTGPKNVCYVEVNNNDLRNVGKYTLTTGGKQLFDIAIIFAANINYDAKTKKAVLFFNPQVTNVLNNKATYIQSLQSKGIKVLLSILGNHQGSGISNFASQADAQAFAKQLSDAVTTYGLDGIDFDDEYSEYGKNGTGQPNSSSFVYLVTALRQLMPTKIISFYFIGPAADNLSYNGITVGSKVDYSWNAYYGSYSAPNVPGMAKANLGPAAVQITSTPSSTAKSLATKTLSDDYGIFMCYDLPNTDQHTYLSGISQILYGSATTYTP